MPSGTNELEPEGAESFRSYVGLRQQMGFLAGLGQSLLPEIFDAVGEDGAS